MSSSSAQQPPSMKRKIPRRRLLRTTTEQQRAAADESTATSEIGVAGERGDSAGGDPSSNSAATATLSIVGLGCSSFSTFFWTDEEVEGGGEFDVVGGDGEGDDRMKHHPRVREWIRTVHYAVRDAGINLLDTAPWYGHGSSEVVVGWALEELLQDDACISRQDLLVNTKVGRYEAAIDKQFDYSRETTLASIQRSLRRLRCGYIDVLQVHDCEFAPTLDQLLDETIPAMLEARDKGFCRRLGLTGYPLEVQHQLFEVTLERFGDAPIWDQALTYCHYSLHDTSLLTTHCFGPSKTLSFAEYCEQQQGIPMLAAAPLGMGLLTKQGPPQSWHPASSELRGACRQAASICRDAGVDIATLAILFALSQPRIPCTILGIKNVEEVKFVQDVACRLVSIDDDEVLSTLMSQEDMLSKVLTSSEREALDKLRDPVDGPFASVWKNGKYQWDGVELARNFWDEVKATASPNLKVDKWQETSAT